MNGPALACGDRVLLRMPRETDRAAFSDGVRASERLHDPWLDPGDPDAWFDRLLARNTTETDRSLLVCRLDDGQIVGTFNLSQIFFGPFRNAYLGYYAFEPHAGHGLMRQGLRLLLAHAFDDLGPAPDPGQHPTGERGVDRTRARRRVPQGGLLGALPDDPRGVARP